MIGTAVENATRPRSKIRAYSDRFEALGVRRATPGFDVRRHQHRGQFDAGDGTPRPPQLQQPLAKPPLSDAGLSDLLPLGDVGDRFNGTAESLQVIGRALIVFEPENELARLLGSGDRVEEYDAPPPVNKEAQFVIPAGLRGSASHGLA
jgi:hypothetical protein